jgi:hypothetical protein
MKTRLMIVTFIGTVILAQGQNQPAPAAAEGPGIAQDSSAEPAQANQPGPGQRGPRGPRKSRGPEARRSGGPGQTGGQFAGPEAEQMAGLRPGPGGPGMGPEGGFEMAGGPESGGAPEFDEGSSPAEMGPDESDANEGPGGPPEQAMGGQGFGEGPWAGGGPGFGNGPAGQFGPRREQQSFGPMGLPPGDAPGNALQAVLSLDDKQVQSLRQLQREKSRKLDESQFQLRQKQDVLMDLLEQEEPDGNALVSTVKSLHALRKQAGEIEKEFQAKTAAVLNEEQKTKLKSIQEQRQIPQARQEAARFNLPQPRKDAPRGAVPQK